MKSYGSGNGVADRLAATALATPPIACPACRSSSISTTARNPDANAYWRCGRCGEVWNASRREAGPTGRQRWR